MDLYFENDFMKLYNGDCIEYLKNTEDKVDCVLTSPPYNTGRASTSELSRKHHWGRYDEYMDEKTPEEYLEWTICLFNLFERVLNQNGMILYNVSYGNDVVNDPNKNTNEVMFKLPCYILENTPFTIADRIIWKKKAALPNNVSPNKLTRITEDVYVFVRKDELFTFNCNKEVSSYNKYNQPFYNNIFNFVEAKNNDGSCDLNKATYSSELCEKLLKIYCKSGNTILDPFNGTGTTGVACRNLNMNYIGVEISKEQCEYTVNRINGVKIIKTSSGEELVQEGLF